MFGTKKLRVSPYQHTQRELQHYLDQGWTIVKQNRPIGSSVTFVTIRKPKKGQPPTRQTFVIR